MKAKKILITYLNNGNLQSQVAKEYLFNHVVDSLTNEGRVISETVLQQSSKTVSFEDGTKVYVVPFGTSSHGIRLTHVYFDSNALAIPKAEELKTLYLGAVVSGDYLNFDTTDEGRKFSFNYDNGQLNIQNI